MAIYDYECSACGHAFEAVQQDPNNPQKVCPECKQETLKKVFSSPRITHKFSLLDGGREAPIYKDLNKKYKDAAASMHGARYI